MSLSRFTRFLRRGARVCHIVVDGLKPLPCPTAIELRILSVIPTRNPNPTLTLQETHTAEITIRSRIKRMKTAL